MSLPVGMRCPRNTSATKLFGPPSFVLRSSSRNALFQSAHGLGGKIMIAGQLALIVAAVFAGRGSLRQHRRTARAVRARRSIFAHRMEARARRYKSASSRARATALPFATTSATTRHSFTVRAGRGCGLSRNASVPPAR